MCISSVYNTVIEDYQQSQTAAIVCLSPISSISGLVKDNCYFLSYFQGEMAVTWILNSGILGVFRMPEGVTVNATLHT